VVPLQAFLSQNVLVLSAEKEFTMSEPSFGDEKVHLCSQTCPADYYSSRSDSADLTAKAADAIRAVLKAYQVNFGEEIKQAGEDKKRAIYSVDIQFDATKERTSVLGFSFAPTANLDYNEAFKALFFDEVANLITI